MSGPAPHHQVTDSRIAATGQATAAEPVVVATGELPTATDLGDQPVLIEDAPHEARAVVSTHSLRAEPEGLSKLVLCDVHDVARLAARGLGRAGAFDGHERHGQGEREQDEREPPEARSAAWACRHLHWRNDDARHGI